MDAIADTCFYIDLHRGRARASDWLKANSEARLLLTPITYGELAVGQPDVSLLDNLVGPGPRLELDYFAAIEFGNAARHLRALGQMIGSNDLWIASIALANGLPIVTRNVDEFQRVPRLQVITY